MKKNLLSNLMLLWLLCLSIAPALAQQNQKIVLPTPNGFSTSTGLSVTPSADGGYILLGQVEFTDWNTIGIDFRPRIVKLDANLNTVWDNLYVPPLPGKGGLTFPQGDAFELPDGDIIVGLHNDSSDIHFLRLNADGSLQYQTAVAGFQRFAEVLDVLSNGNFLLFNGANTPSIKHLDPNGVEVYNKVLGMQGIEDAPTVLANGDLLFRKFNFNQLTRTDNLGNIIWQIQPPAGSSGIVALPGGGFGLYFYTAQMSKWNIRFFDDAGMETGVSPDLPISGQVSGMRSYPDGSFLASGTTVTNRGFMARFNADATLVWSAESPEDNQTPLTSMFGAPTADGWGAGVGGTLSQQMGFMRVHANSGIVVNTLTGTVRHDADENCIADPNEPHIQHPFITASNALETFTTHADAQGQYTLFLPSGDFTITTNPNHPFFFQCPTLANTVSFPQGSNGSATLDLPIQSLDIIHEIKGKITLDQNDDCIADPAEPPAKFWDLQVKFASGSINLKTNNAGEYQVFVPDGNYTIQAFPWNDNFGICGQSTRSVNFSSPVAQSRTEDFVTLNEMDCTDMRLTLNSTRIRPCSLASVLINYQNAGTIVAEDVTIDVTLDPALEYLNAFPAPTTIAGNILHFELGDFGPGQDHVGGHISITVMPSCSLAIGQQVCLSAHITPDTPCDDPNAWQGAIVAVEGKCSPNSDSIIFKIKNIGNAPNAGLLDFVITEDQIVLHQGNFQLAAGGEQIEAVLPMPPMPPDSSTVTITAEQEPGAPGPDPATFSITNCNGISGGNPSGMGNGSGPFSYSKCFEVRNSLDPNDKIASPLGFGPDKIIRQGTPLEYTIHFQNTGNDTAFLVILRDTLSDKLDHSRIELLGASHPFDFAQINDSILHIRFDNILLPDSLTNPEASQGYITFRIYPEPNLSDGTVVNNRAAIYFDQNPPIITHNVWRTYGEYFVVSTDDLKDTEQIRVDIAPNPFISETTFVLPEILPEGAYQLQIFDVSGKLIRSQSFSEKRCQLNRDGLASGIHFWNITGSGKVLASGKIVAGN